MPASRFFSCKASHNSSARRAAIITAGPLYAGSQHHCDAWPAPASDDSDYFRRDLQFPPPGTASNEQPWTPIRDSRSNLAGFGPVPRDSCSNVGPRPVGIFLVGGPGKRLRASSDYCQGKQLLTIALPSTNSRYNGHELLTIAMGYEMVLHVPPANRCPIAFHMPTCRS